jgi:rhamnose utilization protein RhaD (predicted bifunctional aldolase and dehydrogenase)
LPERTPPELTALSQSVGDPSQDLCILAEGNTSCLDDDGAMWIKASGRSLVGCSEGDFVRVNAGRVVAALDLDLPDDDSQRAYLDSARLDPATTEKASTEAFMHAWLLRQEGVRFVGHGHPTALLSVLSLLEARELAGRRLFPDEIVLCGPAACWVPYVRPGLLLARAIRERAALFAEAHGGFPKTFWLQNHGLIAVGGTAKEVESALAMSVKAGRVLLDALQTGRELRFLTKAEIAAIAGWPDEHARQKKLWG